MRNIRFMIYCQAMLLMLVIGHIVMMTGFSRGQFGWYYCIAIICGCLIAFALGGMRLVRAWKLLKHENQIN